MRLPQLQVDLPAARKKQLLLFSRAQRRINPHPLIKRIGFIGAPGTGRLIQREAASAGVKYVSLELGGKNALIVMPDADLARAADSAVSGSTQPRSTQLTSST